MVQRKSGKSDRTVLFFCLSVCFTMVGWYFRSDVRFSDRAIMPAYSVSLGENCESDLKACHIVANPPIGYRPETTRDEVVAIDFAQGAGIAVYRDCAIWDAFNWTCENDKIAMRYGVMDHNDFDTRKDLYYVPKIAWKMAKLHILPLDTVRLTPLPRPVRKS